MITHPPGVVLTPLEDEALHEPLQGSAIFFHPGKPSLCVALPLSPSLSFLASQLFSHLNLECLGHARHRAAPPLSWPLMPRLLCRQHSQRTEATCWHLSSPSHQEVPIGSEKRGVMEVRGEVTQRACRPELNAENFTPGSAENPIYLPLLRINADITPTTRQKK